MEKKILVYGYGNPGRMDDGLGNSLVDMLEEWAKNEDLGQIEFDSNYQLNIEDADNISGYDLVIFADASEEPIEDFILTKVDASDAKIEFTMHAVSCSYILDLAKKMYDSTPDTYLLHMKGYEWDFKEELTPKAKENLSKAFEFMKKVLKNVDAIEEYVVPDNSKFWNN